jgi:threonine/homoserine/homoserine lactone efflux protein
VGFIFSVPVAGPISILITSHALKGESRYCIRAACGAAILDFIYCFISVYGFTHLYLRYEHVIPYVLIAGSLLIFYFGIQIIRTRLDLDHLKNTGHVSRCIERAEQKGGFRAGLALNFLNPSLFIGWLTASFMVISLVSSLGLKVGNLNVILKDNIGTINEHALHKKADAAINLRDSPLHPSARAASDQKESKPFALSQAMNSLVYAFFVGLGTIVWFCSFSKFLIRKRQKLNVTVLNRIIQLLGVALCLLGGYLFYTASRIIQGASSGLHARII